MSTVSLPNAGTTFRSTKLFSQMAKDIAKRFGIDGDDEEELYVRRQIELVIDELNTMKLWRFNLLESATITGQAGQSDYALPANLWRMYNARKTNDIDYSLSHLRQYGYDTLFQSQNNITGHSYIYVTFNIYRDGTMELFPQPEGGEEYVVRYFQLISKPSTDETLDIPEPYQMVPEYGASALVASYVDQDTKFWTMKYEQGKQMMIDDDEDEGDENLRFINIEEYDARNMAFINPALRPRYLDFY
jgi:hypothetical protein